eukprot:TRINITY_DN2686_c0_g1_i1.p1 TRINITY_DN2686_c0_g1~~TRINITY_DN2686_c0_g1_i1.p1  ORF type:complete len:666 (-),score=124.14 TRINITY_DN2686_c0_g1_i1:629-2626(-)
MDSSPDAGVALFHVPQTAHTQTLTSPSSSSSLTAIQPMNPRRAGDETPSDVSSFAEESKRFTPHRTTATATATPLTTATKTTTSPPTTNASTTNASTTGAPAISISEAESPASRPYALVSDAHHTRAPESPGPQNITFAAALSNASAKDHHTRLAVAAKDSLSKSPSATTRSSALSIAIVADPIDAPAIMVDSPTDCPDVQVTAAVALSRAVTPSASSVSADAADSHGGRKFQLQTLHPDKHVGKQRRMSALVNPIDVTNLMEASTFEITPLYGAISDEGFNATYNQDVLCTLQNINGTKGTALFGMLDGHGRAGEEAAQLTRDAIVSYFSSNVGDKPSAFDNMQLHDIFTKSFLHAQKVTEDSGNQFLLSGTTASLAFIDGTRLTLAHAGDSRIVLGRECYECAQIVSAGGGSSEGRCTHLIAVPATLDHRVGDLPAERQRIEKCGGIVSRDPKLPQGEYDDLRIYAEGQAYPGLVTSRSIGDTLAHTIGVISDPDVTSKKLDRYDRLLILATDGVWDILSNQEAVNIASKYTDAKEATNALVEVCIKGWSNEFDAGDNVSAIVVFLNSNGNQPAISSICKKTWTWSDILEKKDTQYSLPPQYAAGFGNPKSTDHSVLYTEPAANRRSCDITGSQRKTEIPKSPSLPLVTHRRWNLKSSMCNLL